MRPGAPIVESTSGTLGLGWALAGINYGHPVILVIDPGMEPSMRQLLTAYGARLDIVHTPHPTGGWQQARRDRMATLLSELPDAYRPDQTNNADNPAAYRPLAAEHGGRQVGVGESGQPGGDRVGRRHGMVVARAGDCRVDELGDSVGADPGVPAVRRGFLALAAVVLVRFFTSGGVPMLRMMGGAPDATHEHHESTAT